MDNIKTFAIGLLAVLTGFLGVSLFSNTKLVVGGNSGPDHYFAEFFNAGLTVGGGVSATSTSGTVVPLLARDFDEETTVDVTLNVQDATLSFPASSTLASFLPKAGDTKTLLVRNATTTAAMDLTITGGTGVLLKKATTTAVVYGDTDGANYAKIDLTRKSNTDIEALLNIFMD